MINHHNYGIWFQFFFHTLIWVENFRVTSSDPQIIKNHKRRRKTYLFICYYHNFHGYSKKWENKLQNTLQPLSLQILTNWNWNWMVFLVFLASLPPIVAMVISSRPSPVPAIGMVMMWMMIMMLRMMMLVWIVMMIIMIMPATVAHRRFPWFFGDILHASTPESGFSSNQIEEIR